MNFKEQLIHAGVMLKGDFILRSGKESSIYIEKDLIYCNKELLKRTIDEMVFTIQSLNENFDVIVGPERGGLILAVPLSLELNKTFAFTEKQELHNINFMVFRDVYIDVVKNKNILIVDDIITTGGSINRTMDAIKQAEGIIAGIVCIWNRGNISNVGNVPVHSIINEKVD